MINATPPQCPNITDDIYQDPTPGIVERIVRYFTLPWYNYFDGIHRFMEAIRSAPLQLAQADLAAFTAKLTNAQAGKKPQAGIQIWIGSPHNHLLRWTGSVWTFAPGDTGSGYTATFLTAPTADGWAQCDGSTVSYLLANGTVADQILPNTAGLYFRR